MNRTIFWRLMWKEYRLQRAFWISLAVLGAMLLFLIWEFNDHPAERARWLLYTALCLPVFYALGCASTMFAGEHDAGTYQFQRSLPVTASQFFWSKIAFAFLSTLAMIALLCLLAFFMGCGQMPGTNKLNIWIITSEVIWLYIVWGVFFSLILKRPLLAAIVSVIVASLGPLLIPEKPQTTHLYFIDTTFPMMLFYPISIFAGLTVLLAIADVWLGRRWFRETPYPIPLIKSLPKLKVSARPETLTEYMSRGNSWSMLGRLTWQHWRQSSWVLLVIAAMLAPLLFFVCISFWLKHTPRNEWASAIIAIGALAALALPPLAGSFTFLADKRQKSFHFLADRGINPRLIWLSRMWPWTIVIVCAFAALTLFFTAMYFYLWRAYALQQTLHEILFVIVNVYGYIVLSICVGQFCSMFFRSGVLAAVFSLVITGVLCWWAAFMWTLGISWLWSVAPIPLVLLLATWLRAPDWLAERGGWRGWRRPGLTLALAFAALFTALPLYRAYQIPMVDPGFDTKTFLRPLTPEEQATLDLYLQAEKKYSPSLSPKESTAVNDETPINEDQTHPKPWKPSKVEAKWVNANQEVVPLLVEASKGSQFVFTPSSLIDDPSNPMDHAWNVLQMAELLSFNAQILESEGKLDDAIEQYLAVVRISKQLHSGVKCYNGLSGSGDADTLELHVYYHLLTWGAHSGQSPERIKKAIAELEKITADMPAGAAKVKFDYLSDRQMLLDYFKGFPKENIPAMTKLWLHLPWERARALRLLNATLTRYDLKCIDDAEMAARMNRPIYVPPEDSRYPRNYYPGYFRESEYALLQEFWVPPLHHAMQGMNLVREFANLENHRRATLIILALQAWKLEHGDYPKSLDELVGPYLTQLPNDPYGEAYRYYPHGVKIPLQGTGMDFELLSAVNDKPVIWSTSPNIHVALSSELRLDQRYWVYQDDPGTPFGEGRFRLRPADIFEIYNNGHFFLVPQTSD